MDLYDFLARCGQLRHPQPAAYSPVDDELDDDEKKDQSISPIHAVLPPLSYYQSSHYEANTV
jgi:hypothetical protein